MNKQSRSIVQWVLTAISVFLLLRLFLLLLNVALKALGWLQEGNVLDRISQLNISPANIATQIAIFVVVVIVVVILERLQQGDKKQERSEDPT